MSPRPSGHGNSVAFEGWFPIKLDGKMQCGSLIDRCIQLFWEVNNGRAMDVLPWLAPVMSSALAEVQRQTNR